MQSDRTIESFELYFLSPAVQFSTTVIAGDIRRLIHGHVQEEPLPVRANVVLSPEAGDRPPGRRAGGH